MGVPRNHPFYVPIFHERNHPAIGDLPIYENPDNVYRVKPQPRYSTMQRLQISAPELRGGLRGAATCRVYMDIQFQ